MMRFFVTSIVVVLGSLTGLHAGWQGAAPDERTGFHAAIDPAIDAIWSGFDERAAMGHVEFISQYWRLPGNSGYNASIDRIRERLTAGGFSTDTSSTSPHLVVEEYANQGRAWEYSVGTVAIVRQGAADDVVLSREHERLALCINSFSTDPAGVVAPIVDVGAGTDREYTGKDVKGAIVLGNADAGALWRRAVVAGGAIGVISTALPGYLDPDPPNAAVRHPREQWDILQWNSIPYDDARRGFGFKASPRAAARLREAIAAAGATPPSIRVTVKSEFPAGPVRSLVAEIPGRTAPDERVVIAAHVQEPGANDNASGVATGAEMAVSMAAAIRAGRLPAPGRTITFLFITEISGSRQWMQSHPDAARQTKYMFSMDMTGEDVTKTGGTFLIERYPDPGAVWDRPWDPHTEWGRGNVNPATLKGDLINDTHLAVCERVARRNGWMIRTNPYEGGSDHTVFGTAGVPSVLDWHFTDRYYHTNFDTPDKTSAAEMKNVGVAVGATAWLLASASEAQAKGIAAVVAAAGQARIAKETTEGASLPGAEAAVPAWRKWYGEAIRSASRAVVGTPSPALTSALDALALTMEAR